MSDGDEQAHDGKAEFPLGYIVDIHLLLPRDDGGRIKDRSWSPLHWIHFRWTKMWQRSESGPLHSVFSPLNRAVNPNNKCAYSATISWASRVPVFVHILLSEPTSVPGVVITSQRALLCCLTPCIMPRSCASWGCQLAKGIRGMQQHPWNEATCSTENQGPGNQQWRGIREGGGGFCNKVRKYFLPWFSCISYLYEVSWSLCC